MSTCTKEQYHFDGPSFAVGIVLAGLLVSLVMGIIISHVSTDRSTAKCAYAAYVRGATEYRVIGSNRCALVVDGSLVYIDDSTSIVVPETGKTG